MRTFRVFLAVLLAVSAWMSFAPRAKGQQRGVAVEGKKWALLVAANAFGDKRLGRLSHCGDDVEALKKFLIREAGFPENHVIVLRDKPGEIHELPLRLVIEQTLDAFVALPGPDDQVVVAFSLHGVEVRGTPYLCPIDADPDKPEATMLPIPWLYKTLTRCRAAQKIVILDACRKSLRTEDRGVVVEQKPMSRLFAESIRQVPKGLVVLFSCGSGQVSYEDPGLRHGVFMNFILEGLAGRADERGLGRQGNGDGLVDVNELFQYANSETKEFVLKEYNDAQIPEIEMPGVNGVLTAAYVDSTGSRRPPEIEQALLDLPQGFLRQTGQHCIDHSRDAGCRPECLGHAGRYARAHLQRVVAPHAAHILDPPQIERVLRGLPRMARVDYSHRLNHLAGADEPRPGRVPPHLPWRHAVFDLVVDHLILGAE